MFKIEGDGFLHSTGRSYLRYVGTLADDGMPLNAQRVIPVTMLVPLYFAGTDVRMLMRDGEPWWVGEDVARLLDLANPRQVLSRLEVYEKGVHIVDTLGGPQSVIVINESGFYSLLFTSRKPIAKAMKRWLTTEVLPSIRKNGFYDPERTVEAAICEKWTVPVTRHERFMQEIARYEQRTGFQAIDIAGLSRPKIKAISLGASVSGALGRNNLWLYLMSAGFDLRYILWSKQP